MVAVTALGRALTDPPLRALPPAVVELLVRLEAPPRLGAHLRAVHDAAWQLTGALREGFPALEFDRDAVLVGAAVHDAGKVVHPGELSGPGSAHEAAGYELLLAHGFGEEVARCARDHASWGRPDIRLVDLLVSLADKAWKAKRVPELERLVLDRMCAAGGVEPWQAFLVLDGVLDAVAARADARLAFQNSYPLA